MVGLYTANGRIVLKDDILCSEDKKNNLSLFRVKNLLQNAALETYATGFIKDKNNMYIEKEATLHKHNMFNWIHADSWLWTRTRDSLMHFPKVPRKVRLPSKRTTRISVKPVKRSRPVKVKKIRKIVRVI